MYDLFRILKFLASYIVEQSWVQCYYFTEIAHSISEHLHCKIAIIQMIFFNIIISPNAKVSWNLFEEIKEFHGYLK